MRDFDGLPPEVLPWRPKSVHRVYRKTLAKNPDKAQAIARLDTIERHLIAKDARRIWGAAHPYLADEAG